MDERKYLFLRINVIEIDNYFRLIIVFYHIILVNYMVVYLSYCVNDVCLQP
jgi:hypothetical protein